GPAPSGVSQVDGVEPVEVAVDSGAARGAEPVGAGSGGAESGGAEPGGAESWGAELEGAEPGGAEPGGAESGGPEPGGVEPGGAESARVAFCSASSRRELLSPQELREWFARRWSRAAEAGGPPVAPGPGGARTGGTGAVGTGGATTAAGVGPAGASGAAGAGATGGVGAGVGAAVASGAAGAGAAGGVGAGVGPAGGTSGAAGGNGAASPAGVGDVGAGGAAGTGAATGGTGAVPVGSGGPARPRPYFVPLLEQVLGLPPSPGPAPPLEYPQPVQSQSPLQPVSPLPAPSPYAGPTGGLAERREPASRPASPDRTTRTSRRAPRPRPPAVPGTHQMTLRPSTAPLRVLLPSPPESSLPVLADPASDSLRAASPTVARLLTTVVTDPSFESTAASALVAQLVDFAARCRLDYATSLVAESASVCPPSVGGECALSTDVLEDRQEEFQCFAAVLPHLVSTLLAPEGDPDAPDIPTPRSYAEAIKGPYSSQWQSAMDAEMASWKSTGTYVDEVPPPGANIVSGMWIFRVKRPPGSPPVFKARYVARGFSQRQGVDYFQTFSPTSKMTTLRVLLHVAAQRDYELHSLDFSTAFLQGSLHEEIWLRRPPGFTGSFPPGTQWSLRWPVYGLRQAPREWHDTLRTTLAALGFAPSTADPSLFLRTDTSLPPFYILVYVDDLVFATADTAGLAHVKSELQKIHTCTDLGELRSYLGLQITRDRAQRTITLTQSHILQHVLQRFDFTYSSPQATPLSTRHSLSALPSDESVEPSGPYPELVGCLISSCEAEIYARAMAAQELRWLTYLLADLGEPPRSPPVLYVDNKAMLALCREHRLEHRTKHIALRYFLARELQQRGQLRLAYVASEANTADIFTKALPPGDHQRFCTMLDCVVFLLEAHDGVMLGHFGVEKMRQQLQQYNYWPELLTDVQHHVSSCPTCQVMKSSRKRKAGQLQPIPPPKRAWQQVTLDFVTGLPSNPGGNDAVMVAVDRLVKMAHFGACRKSISAEETARLFITTVFRLHEIPIAIISDRDTKNLWENLWEQFGTRLQFSSSYHPKTDGQTEQTNQTMEQLIRATCDDLTTWEQQLPLIEFAYNNATSATTQPVLLKLREKPNSAHDAESGQPNATRTAIRRDFASCLHQSRISN
ncbi:unnamed protein product, partial [Closterium sp. NIES-54]